MYCRSRTLKNVAVAFGWLLVSSLSTAAAAEYTVGQFVKEIEDKENRLVVSIAGLSLERANVQLIVQKRQPFFCPPRNYAIQPSEHAEILKGQIGNDEDKMSKSWNMVPFYILLGLIEKYPCKNP